MSTVFGNSAGLLDGQYTEDTAGVRKKFQIYQSMDPAAAFSKILKDNDIIRSLKGIYRRLEGSTDSDGEAISAAKAGIIRQCQNMSEEKSYRKEGYRDMNRNFTAISKQLDIKLKELIEFVKDNKGKQPGKFTVNENLSRGSQYRNRYGRY